MTDKQLTIREMCEAFDVTPRTLRFYESKELICPKRVGQKRLYSKRDMARVKLILRGKRFGFSLEDIRQLLELYNLGDQQRTQFERTFDLAQQKLKDMREQRKKLDQTITELENQLEWGRKIMNASETKAAAE